MRASVSPALQVVVQDEDASGGRAARTTFLGHAIAPTAAVSGLAARLARSRLVKRCTLERRAAEEMGFTR